MSLTFAGGTPRRSHPEPLATRLHHENCASGTSPTHAPQRQYEAGSAPRGIRVLSACAAPCILPRYRSLFVNHAHRTGFAIEAEPFVMFSNYTYDFCYSYGIKQHHTTNGLLIQFCYEANEWSNSSIASTFLTHISCNHHHNFFNSWRLEQICAGNKENQISSFE